MSIIRLVARNIRAEFFRDEWNVIGMLRIHRGNFANSGPFGRHVNIILARGDEPAQIAIDAAMRSLWAKRIGTNRHRPCNRATHQSKKKP